MVHGSLNILITFGSQINSLSRWEVINKVRTMSTEAARAGEEGGLLAFLLISSKRDNFSFVLLLHHIRVEASLCKDFSLL